MRTLQNFVPIAEPTYGIMRKVAFLMALDNWSRCEKEAFSKLAPPVDALRDDTSDENAVLAAVFYRLCQKETLTDQIALIQLEIFHHHRLFAIAWEHAKGESDTRYRAQRTTFHELRPYQEMIAVIENWAEALHQRATEP